MSPSFSGRTDRRFIWWRCERVEKRRRRRRGEEVSDIKEGKERKGKKRRPEIRTDLPKRFQHNC